MREPTLGEVALTLARMEQEFLRRFDEIATDLRQTVQAEVYEAQRQALLAQIAAAHSEVAEVRSEMDRRITETAATAAADLAREREARDQLRREDQARADRRDRWVVFILGAALTVLSIVVAVIGIFVK